MIVYNGYMEDIRIETARLTLRPLGTGDLATTHAYASDAENTKYMMFLPNESVVETRVFLEECENQWQSPQPEQYEFAILLNGVHIGAVSLYFENGPEVCELGWVLAAPYHGHGYATEAARAAMAFARDRLCVRRFIAHCDAENLASQGVMRKLGMVLTDDSGTRKNRGSDEVRRELRYEVIVD